MPTEGIPLRRGRKPSEKPRFHVRIKSLEARERWEALARVLPTEMIACWDHLAMTPTLLIPGGKSHRLKGRLSYLWQYKPSMGFRYRIWYIVHEPTRLVLVQDVWERHP